MPCAMLDTKIKKEIGTLVEKPKIIYVTCLAHRLAQNKSSVSVSYYSNDSTTEDPSAYENTPRRLCFHFPQCTVLSISLLIATGSLPARQTGPDKCTTTHNTMSNMIRMAKTKYYGRSK